MKKQTKPYIFFDQNVMEKLSKKKYTLFQRNVKPLIIDKGKDVKQRLTPFGLLEFAGLNKHELFDIKYHKNPLNEYRIKDFKEIDTHLIPTLENQIRKKISKQFLKEKLEDKKQKDLPYLNERGVSLIDRYIEKMDSIYETLVQSLLLDRLSEVNTSNFSNMDKQKFITGLTGMVMGIICSGQNMGSFRVLCRLIDEIKKEQNRLGELTTNDKLLAQKIKKVYNLKSSGDLVDCELVHLAFFGADDKHCHCYTTDDAQQIKERLELYCFYTYFFIWLFFEYPRMKNMPPSNISKKHIQPEWRCGKVFILNKETGEKITKISVTKIYEQIRKQSTL